MKKQLLYIISLILFVHLGYSENTDNILKGLSYKDINSFRCVSFYSNSKIEFSDESDWSTNRIWNRIFEYDILEEGSLSYLVIKKNNFVEKKIVAKNSVVAILKAHSEEVACGDFSFIENIDLTDSAKEYIEKWAEVINNE